MNALVPGVCKGLNVNKTIEKLKIAGHITPDGHWALFPVSTTKVASVEDLSFVALVKVTECIVSASGGKEEDQLLELVQHPDEKPVAYTRTPETKPDGCFALKNRPLTCPRWQDIALCAGYKKEDQSDDRNDHVSKVLWSMHQCMRQDARHRFVYGMTIENETMRLWFSSRADTLMSQEINWRTDHETVVHFLLAMLYAEEAEVGWDPTIKYIVQDGKFVPGLDGAPQMEICVQDEGGNPAVWYRTHRILADHGVHGVPGRGTRVWQAYELTEGNGEKRDNPVALKDSWIDHARPKEGQTMEEIHASVKESNSEDYELFEKFLLTVLHHGTVSVKIGGRWEVDHTRDLMRRGLDPLSDYGGFKFQESPESGISSKNLKGTESSFPLNAGTGHHLSRASQQRPSTPAPRLNHPRVHYRIVFKEVCVCIYDLTSLEDIFHALIDALIALAIMHGAGWVHRDISPGNVLAERLPDGTIVGKVTDFEYATRFGGTEGCVVIIAVCVQDFMAVEVEAMRYRFFFGEPQHARRDTKIRVLCEFLEKVHLGDSGRNQTPADAKPDQPVPEQPAFRYNPLHDVKSLWWVCTYFVFNKAVILVNGVEPSMDPELEGNYSMQLQYASRLFWTQQFREWAMTRPGDFKDEVIHLHAVVRPANYLLDTMRYRLQNQYRSIEETLTPITHMVASDITMQMIEDLGDICQGPTSPLSGTVLVLL
ncbi:hypothetical protein IEO21_09291 [Rhodonia placenta]|uniref:Fungal-type protein kinase domain-containing protein n=1 Tax=Rhodonia placenta TaxID=104341 RepID=A0A8H7TYD3_9APHY|nr:hypothetical protein IEO21_09291 [Postia placenta]